MEEKRALKLAFYGKGGIGKSTITANLAAEFGRQGKRVLYIGCDPKADSTRKLVGHSIPTVLQQINALGESLQETDVLFPGAYGVQCIEAGGPEAGIGCAGMGLSAMAAELQRHSILDAGWDVILYDVLGDVVCSGFSLPMRKKFADRVYIVTSSDYMSLYAANVILKGLLRCAGGDSRRLGGFIQNRCKSPADVQMVRAFTDMAGSKCVGTLAEHAEILWSDYQEAPVVCRYPASPAAAEFQALAERLLLEDACPEPRALTEEELEIFRLRQLQEVAYPLGNDTL